MAKKSQSVPEIVMDNYGYAYLTRRDKRSADFDIYFAVDKSVKVIVRLLTPNGGEALSSNSNYTIGWQSLAQAVQFNLFYSWNDGVIWKKINDNPITNSTIYPWTVPDPLGNKKCIIKASGYDAEGKRVGESASPFTIKGVKVTFPDEEKTFAPEQEVTITWDVYTKRPVERIKLYLTRDGGAPWTLITKPLAGTVRSYLWTVPDVTKTRKKC